MIAFDAYFRIGKVRLGLADLLKTGQKIPLPDFNFSSKMRKGGVDCGRKAF